MLLLSLPTLVHLNQLSVILLCSSLQLRNICIPITDGSTHFLIKFVLLRVPLSRKKKPTSRASPPPNRPLTHSVVFVACIRNDIPRCAGSFMHAGIPGMTWSHGSVSIRLKCFTPTVKCRRRVWKSQHPRKSLKPCLPFLHFNPLFVFTQPKVTCLRSISKSTVVFLSLCFCKHFNLQLENYACSEVYLKNPIQSACSAPVCATWEFSTSQEK